MCTNKSPKKAHNLISQKMAVHYQMSNTYRVLYSSNPSLYDYYDYGEWHQIKQAGITLNIKLLTTKFSWSGSLLEMESMSEMGTAHEPELKCQLIDELINRKWISRYLIIDSLFERPLEQKHQPLLQQPLKGECYITWNWTALGCRLLLKQRV